MAASAAALAPRRGRSDEAERCELDPSTNAFLAIQELKQNMNFGNFRRA
jgi:hypothetical protein